MHAAAIEALQRGENVAVEAVPGAGKTRLILEACNDGVRTLILAYNKELADKVSQAIDATAVTCLTFHALCSRCLAPARDDHQLLKVVERAERGELVPSNVPEVARVLIDEAQDVRTLYVRLVRVLGLARDGVSLLVAGDKNQLVYDFDEDFPATLDTLERPHLGLGGGVWTRVTLQRSSRVTNPMAQLVNRIFGTSIESRRDGPRVEVRAPRSMYSGLYHCLADVLTGDESVLLLVDRKAGNRALRTLLNTASRKGRAVQVHGVDDVGDGAIQCGTFWSAKGLECKSVVVLLPGGAPRNPTYVALTRSSHRLIVVLDPREPHPAVSKAVANCPEHVAVLNAWTQTVIDAGCALDEATAFVRSVWNGAGRSGLQSIERLCPRPGVMEEAVSQNVEEEGIPLLLHPDESQVPSGMLAQVFLTMGLVHAEFVRTGIVRGMQDILHPTRLDIEQLSDAIRSGLMSRTIPRYVSDDVLLANDLRELAERSYKQMKTDADLANVALAILSWDSWDHMMRSMQPASEWASQASRAVDFIHRSIPKEAAMDVRLCRYDRHARVHASAPEACYHVVWESASADVAMAAVRAALHPKQTCRLLEVATERSTTLVVDDVAALLSLDDAVVRVRAETQK